MITGDIFIASSIFIIVYSSIFKSFIVDRLNYRKSNKFSNFEKESKYKYMPYRFKNILILIFFILSLLIYYGILLNLKIFYTSNLYMMISYPKIFIFYTIYFITFLSSLFIYFFYKMKISRFYAVEVINLYWLQIFINLIFLQLYDCCLICYITFLLIIMLFYGFYSENLNVSNSVHGKFYGSSEFLDIEKIRKSSLSSEFITRNKNI